VYIGPNSEEVEVRVYRCPENKAATIQSNIQGFVKSVQDGRAPSRYSYRQKVNYTQSNSAQRTVTFGFSDALNQNHEYGKVWYNHDWMFSSGTTQQPTTIPFTIDVSPPKYLGGVGKRATAPKPEPKTLK